LRSFQKGLIGWKIAGPPKKPLLFSLCKEANDHFNRGRLSIEAFSSQFFLFAILKAFSSLFT